MPESYFVTYGGDRVTFGGTPGAVAWEYPSAMVLLHPEYADNNDYLKMRFVTPDGSEIIMQDGSAGNVSASAMVPVNSTAYWTANGAQGASASYHVSSLGESGFSGISAYTAVTTGFYADPNVESYGSAVLTATGSASAKTNTTKSWKAVYGQGSTDWNTKISASSWVGEYDDGYGTASQRVMWIPDGARVSYMVSSTTGRTYSFSTALTSLSGYGINYNHKGVGTTGGVTGFMNTARGFYIGSGRNKNVYATGTAYTLSTTDSASAAVWQPFCIITGFSSNLSTGSSISTFLVGSANVNQVYGFNADTILGQIKNSAGTWKTATDGNGTNRYRWGNMGKWVSNSAHLSGNYSAMRHKGATATSNIAGWSMYGKNSSNAAYNMTGSSFSVPSASAKTSTYTATANTALTGASACCALLFSITVAQHTAIRANCRGAFTASGRVI